VQWTGDNRAEVQLFARHQVEFLVWERVRSLAGCQLLAGKNGAQGLVEVPRGHWIVRAEGDDSDYWPVEDSYFRAKYREVETDG
jgi:hypothetical protein